MRDLFMILSCLLVAFHFTKAQSVVISEESDVSPASSAILDVQSTDQGILIPRMTRAQRDNIASPSNGLLIYQTDNTPGFYYRDGAAWVSLRGSGGITSETDPQVGIISNNYIPIWNGNELISSDIMKEDEDIFFGNGSKISLNGNGWFTGYLGIVEQAINQAAGVKYDKAYMTINSNGSGEIRTKGADNDDKPTVRIGTWRLSDGTYPNTQHGSVEVYGPKSGRPLAGMYIKPDGVSRIFAEEIEAKTNLITSGAISASIKNFIEPHPLDRSKEIVYASVEGPEAAMYIRGTAELVNGKYTIKLPEHYRLLADENSMTVLLTPLSKSSYGLAVTIKSLENGIVVEELMNGIGSYEFDWEVKCVRKGFEDYQVVRPSSSAAQ